MNQADKRYIIDDNEIHIWKFYLDPEKSTEKLLLNLLSSEEKKQINNIKIEDVKIRRIISKAIIKNIISNYLGINTMQVIFSYNEFGKPVISDSINYNNLNFNISHSGNLGIIALTRKNSIGIDVEQMKELEEIDDIINLCFSDYEKNLFTDLKLAGKNESIL